MDLTAWWTVTVLVGCLLAGIPLGARAVAGWGRGDAEVVPATGARPRSDETPAGRRPGRRAAAHPGTWLLAAVGAVLGNQVLFTIWVLRVHDGDTGFVRRYFPPGWFAVPRGTAVDRVAGWFPHPELLAPCLLRIPALLELPIVVLAYLTAARWLSPGLGRRLLAPSIVRATCLGWSLVFAAIEWDLHNPWTADDLWLRAASAILTVLGLARLRERTPPPSGPDRPRTAGELLIALVSVAALGQLVLELYDTALLYNLARVPGRLPVVAVTAAVLAAARWQAARQARRRRPATGPGTDLLITSLIRFTALFLVPALPLRYSLGFAPRWAAAIGGVIILFTAAAGALSEVVPRTSAAAAADRGPVVALRWATQLLFATVAATAAGLAGTRLPGYPEARLLTGSVAFLLVGTAALAWGDRVLWTGAADTSR